MFWEENKKEFKQNVRFIVDKAPFPKGWKVYVVAANFLFEQRIFPFDYDSWSSTNLIAATKKQGHEVMLFMNRARSEFLSVPALVPLLIHELFHVKQAAKNPKKYLMSIVNDDLSIKIEREAEKALANISDEFRKQWVLESVLYCFDVGGWNLANKMADFLHKEMENLIKVLIRLLISLVRFSVSVYTQFLIYSFSNIICIETETFTKHSVGNSSLI